MTDFVPLAAGLALIYSSVNLLKYLKAGDVNAVVTQLVVWAAGVGVFALLAATNWADGIKVGELALGQLNFASLVLVGVSAGSAASVGFDVKKAIDKSDSAHTPPLVGP